MATGTLDPPITEELPPQPDPIPEPIPQRTDVEKGVKLVFDRHIAHEGIMLDRMNRQLHQSERMQKFAATGNIKDLEAPAEESPEMGVNIGNETHNHFQMTEKTSPPAASPITTAVIEKASGPMKYLASALVGGGLVLAGNLLSTWWQQPEPTQPPAVTQPSDVNYKLGVTVSD